MKSDKKSNIIFFAAIVFLVVLSSFYFFRIDLTSDKRFSVSAQAKELMKSVKEPVNVTVYLTGDLNSGFLRLKNNTVEMLDELNAYSHGKVNIAFENLAETGNNEKREENAALMEKKGMSAITVYEKDKTGKAVQKQIYPWMEVSSRGKSVPVNLLQNNRSLSGEENLNNSIENLEFALTDAIRRLVNTKIEKIAFLEGHGELTEAETYDISKSLSSYFQIDRGTISNNESVLNNYKAVIIAKPTRMFSEKDKFVIDQYIMQGGTALWLLDGVQISEENLSKNGETPVMALDLNLNDMLFRYGVRINPVLVEDVQSVMMPLNVAPKGQQPQYEPFPWIYAPLLLTSNVHPVTKNLPPVKAEFASMIEAVSNEKNISKTEILASSANTHLLQAPATISLGTMPDLKNKNYFNVSYAPVGVILEGIFTSDFENRMVPPEIVNPRTIRKSSVQTRQIVIADGDIIRNEMLHTGDSIQTLPLGYDRYSNQQFGNKELITNAVLYLTDKEGWMKLRSRTIPLRLLNKNLTLSQRTTWQIINVIVPLLLLLIFGIIYFRIRKRKYAR